MDVIELKETKRGKLFACGAERWQENESSVVNELSLSLSPETAESIASHPATFV